MTSAISDLISAALEKDGKIEDLLRLAYTVAIQLDVDDFKKWLEKELYGYHDATAEEIPRYRHVIGSVKGFNHVHNVWRPIFFENTQVAKSVTTRPINSSISELSSLLSDPAHSDDSFISGYAPDQLMILQKAIGEKVDIQLHIHRAAIAAILDTAKTTVLKWALELQKKGVTGENMSFSPKEKNVAQSIQIQSVQQLSVVGSSTGQLSVSQTQSNGISSVDLIEILKFIGDLTALNDSAPKNEIAEQNQKVRSAIDQNAERGVMRKLLESTKTILEKSITTTATKVLTTRINELIDRLT